MSQDHLIYFDVRARAEPTRMLYALAGEKFTDERIAREDWEKRKSSMPSGQVPVLKTKDGLLNQSNVIARYVAKKLGLAGSGLWEETLHDLVVENVLEVINEFPKVYRWLVFKMAPEPENKEEQIQSLKDKFCKAMGLVEKLAKERSKKFIVNDKLGLGEVWLYSALEFSKLAIPDAMTLTPWVKQFTEAFEADQCMKKYLSERPPSTINI